MTPNEYQKLALRTASEKALQDPVLNGVLGLGGESGECLEIVKKERFHDHELDIHSMARELGDVAWYLALTAYGIGYDFDKILEINIDKLKERYPEGFLSIRSYQHEEGEFDG